MGWMGLTGLAAAWMFLEMMISGVGLEYPE
jgi:hypothetical protein